MENKFKISDSNVRTIGSILNSSFIIPSYQRGYKWSDKQVEDILKDISYNISNGCYEKMYSLQPLVIRKNDGQYRVIDGQQRLTTIFIICVALGIKDIYSIEYESRVGSKEFLLNIIKTQEPCYDNSDYYYISKAYLHAKEWIKKYNDQEALAFKNYLIDKCFFLWYEPNINQNIESEIKVFNSLNSGKISLNDSELIKAEVIGDDDKNNVASKWDEIEFKLQNNELFYFAYGNDKFNPKDIIDSRIQILFQILLNVYNIDEDRKLYEEFIKTKCETRNYFDYFSSNENDRNILFLLSYICDWYDDKILYHLIGYLIWCDDKETFKNDEFLSEIKELQNELKDNDVLNKIKDEKSIIGKIYILYKNLRDRNKFIEFIKKECLKHCICVMEILILYCLLKIVTNWVRKNFMIIAIKMIKRQMIAMIWVNYVNFYYCTIYYFI